MAHMLYLPLCRNVLYCVHMFVCIWSVECPPYQVKFLVGVHTWPIKLILIITYFYGNKTGTLMFCLWFCGGFWQGEVKCVLHTHTHMALDGLTCWS